MLNLKFFKWSFIAVLLSGFLFSSCSKDDDMSLEEMQDEIRRNGNDLMVSGLFGAVKSYKNTSYNNSTWQNNAVAKGDKSYERTYEYDKNGFWTKTEENYYGSNERITRSTCNEIISRDNKNRITERIESSKQTDYESYEKYEYTYDDSKKEAICIYSYSADGINYEVSSKTVYKLNKYGKIDNNNSEYFPLLRSANDGNNDFDTNASSGQYSTYDAKGNITQSYSKQEQGDYIYIYNYNEVSYTYY